MLTHTYCMSFFVLSFIFIVTALSNYSQMSTLEPSNMCCTYIFSQRNNISSCAGVFGLVCLYSVHLCYESGQGDFRLSRMLVLYLVMESKIFRCNMVLYEMKLMVNTIHNCVLTHVCNENASIHECSL